MNKDLTGSLFPLGQIVMTRGAAETFSVLQLIGCLGRHSLGDWGDLDEEDQATNAEALEYGFRLFSSYRLPAGKLWIITEADRSVTTLLLPEEY